MRKLRFRETPRLTPGPHGRPGAGHSALSHSRCWAHNLDLPASASRTPWFGAWFRSHRRGWGTAFSPVSLSLHVRLMKSSRESYPSMPGSARSSRAPVNALKPPAAGGRLSPFSGGKRRGTHREARLLDGRNSPGARCFLPPPPARGRRGRGWGREGGGMRGGGGQSPAHVSAGRQPPPPLAAAAAGGPLIKAPCLPPPNFPRRVSLATRCLRAP